MISYKFIIIIIMFLLTNCGFKAVDYSKINNFKINDMITTGENRINYNKTGGLLRFFLGFLRIVHETKNALCDINNMLKNRNLCTRG